MLWKLAFSILLAEPFPKKKKKHLSGSVLRYNCLQTADCKTDVASTLILSPMLLCMPFFSCRQWRAEQKPEQHHDYKENWDHNLQGSCFKSAQAEEINHWRFVLTSVERLHALLCIGKTMKALGFNKSKPIRSKTHGFHTTTRQFLFVWKGKFTFSNSVDPLGFFNGYAHI